MKTSLTKIPVRTALGLVVVANIACSRTPVRVEPERVLVKHSQNELLLDTPPGTVRDVWAEKMVDRVRIPGQIDPHGVYYRKTHETLIEVRPGRYEQVQYPDQYDHYKE